MIATIWSKKIWLMPMGLHASPASDLVRLISHEALCSSEAVQMVSFSDNLFLDVRFNCQGRSLYNSTLIHVAILSTEVGGHGRIWRTLLRADQTWSSAWRFVPSLARARALSSGSCGCTLPRCLAESVTCSQISYSSSGYVIPPF